MQWHIHRMYLFPDPAHQEGQENLVLHFAEPMLFLHTQCKMYLQIISQSVIKKVVKDKILQLNARNKVVQD